LALGTHEPVQVPALQRYGHAAPLCHCRLALHVCGVVPLHCLVPGAHAPQVPAEHVSSALQVFPHAPQLAASVAVSTHAAPQTVAALPVHTHSLATHEPPVRHTTPHPPQFWASRAVSTQEPAHSTFKQTTGSLCLQRYAPGVCHEASQTVASSHTTALNVTPSAQLAMIPSVHAFPLPPRSAHVTCGPSRLKSEHVGSARRRNSAPASHGRLTVCTWLIRWFIVGALEQGWGSA
jgi:hypothetical protein